MLLLVLIIHLSPSFCTEVILEFTDDKKDDYGDGKVVYPGHSMFQPGIFDIEQFRIEDKGDYYKFVVRVRGKVNYVTFDEYQFRYNLPEKFIFPLIHIYIDTDHVENSGIRETILGVNATINEESAWERAVVFSSIPQRYRLYMEHFQIPFSNRVDIPPKIYLSKNKKEISVRVGKQFIGEIQSEWGFTILMLGHDVAKTIKKNVYVMEVKASSSQFNFGGGHTTLYERYNSNIIDMIVPPFQYQKRILSNYSVGEKRYPEIGAVYKSYKKMKPNIAIGEVKQVSSDKLVINLGAKHGVVTGIKLIIASQFIVEVDDVFPEICVAHYLNDSDADIIEKGMEATIWKE